ncbi:MAG TPA: class I SAM-dependent methyltransferase [Verrucomicrobiae bacterium]|nr:class I SAM-dependent methyltransferase [Verrucomicrobiae bacterium]
MQNAAFANKDALYYVRLKNWMLALIKDGPNVIMDLGCASGRLGERLREVGKAEKVYGVEVFAPAAKEAEKTYTTVHVGDLEDMELSYQDYFDYVICGDIVEHLRDPYRAMERIYSWLKPGGSILVCVPNVRNYAVLRDLIFRGEWEYVSAGILDQTHLRFFTSKSCRRMLERAGFEPYHQQMIVYGPKKNFVNHVTFGLFAEFLAQQVFWCARKPAR